MAQERRITIGHRIQYATYLFFECALRILSVRATYGLGIWLARLAFPFSGSLKKVVSRSLRFAFGTEKFPEELDKLTRDVFEKTTANFLTAIRIPFLSKSQIRESVTITNMALFEETVAQNQGTILIIPHMGNWEFLAQATALAEFDIKVATHYRPLNNPLLNRLIERRRKRRNLLLFPKRTSSHTLAAFLRDNGVLSILADQRIPSKGELCSFFGRPTSCSPLPSLLAKRTNAQILRLHCRTIRPDHWEVTFRAVDGNDAQACASSLEDAWLSAPDDVFWFQGRWKLPKVYPLRALTRAPFPDASTISKPIHLLAIHPAEEEPPACPEFPFPPHLISWETHPFTSSEDLKRLDDESDLPFDLIVTPTGWSGKLPLRSCAIDQLIP